MKKFEDLYNEIKNNEKLNSEWKKIRKEDQKIKRIILPTCIGVTLILLIYIIKLIGFSFTDIPGLCFIVFIVNLIIIKIGENFKKGKGTYDEIFKKIVIEKLINNFYNNVEYFPNKEMPERIYKEVKYERYNKYYSDDYIEAKINNMYDINMAEVKVQQEDTSVDSNGNVQTKTTTKFHGIVTKILIDKSIQSELKIEQNRKIVFSKKRLEMDSSEFEKYFDVYATNHIIGMQLLTADIMEELVEFLNKTNLKYDIVIKNNYIYLRFHCGKVFESGNLKKGVVDKEKIEKYFYILNFTYNLSDKIIKLIHETQI